MLVVSRCKGEKLVIGEGATKARVQVVRVKGDRVWVGVCADAAVRVDRAEVHERREAEKVENETRRVCVGEGLA